MTIKAKNNLINITKLSIMNTNNNKTETFHLMVNGKNFKWNSQYITGIEIRKLAEITEYQILYRDLKPTEDDTVVENNTKIDLSTHGIEKFYSKEDIRTVTISVNNNSYPISYGNHTVSEIKKVANVPAGHELEQNINGQLTPLKDSDILFIQGGESFFSYVKDGTSA